MGTSWIELITDSAMVYIDDIRLTEELQTNPAQFFRRFALYVNAALPLLNKPPELYSAMVGGLEQPTYDDGEWTSTQESTWEETVVETGKVGYDLFSCVKLIPGVGGDVRYERYDGAAYDKETGNVTFEVQDTSDVTYSMDFYTDGEFSDKLTLRQTRLAGLAIAVVWDERFSREWLKIQAKPQDSSFKTPNEANYITSTQNRLRSNRAALSDELDKYEQDCAYIDLRGTRRRSPGLL